MLASALIPPAFLFFSPWIAALTGLAAVSVPVIIHLFSRRRYRIVEWAAMRFLLAAQKQNVRRMKLEQYLLLAARMLLLLLLVLAMASVSPWAESLWAKIFPDSAVLAAGSRRTHKILVLDGSLSMAAKVGDRTAFDQARARAAQILETSPGGDGYSVILMAAPAQRIVPEPSDDPQRVAEEIRKLRLPHGNADLTGALQAVDDMLKRSPGKFEGREVYLLTDMQRSTWIARAGNEAAEVMQRIQGQARVVFVDVGADDLGNLAVTNLTLGNPIATTASVTPIIATIHNFGADEGKAVRVDLLVGRARQTIADAPAELRVVGQETVRVPAGQVGVTVAFSYKFATAGDYAVQVRLEPDHLEPDDARSMIVTVKDTLPVMLVNGKPAVEEYDRATGYLRDALQPSENRAGLLESPVRVKVLSESQFADAALGDLTPYDCVFLCDIARLSNPEIRRLETHLRRGGGVVFCMGPRVDLEAYNRLLWRNGEGILPAQLESIEKTSGDRPYMLFASEESFRQPPLDAFAGVIGRFNLLEPRFFQYVTTRTSDKARGRKVIGFMPEPPTRDRPPAADATPGKLRSGDAAIIEMPWQRGRVALVTTTVNKDWNNWPDRPSLLAMMHELLHFCVAGRLRGHALQVGDVLEEFLPAGAGGLEFTVTTPDARTVRRLTQSGEEGATLRFADADQAGIYKATVGQHPQEYLFAVNVPTATAAQQASESDLTRCTQQSLHDTFPNWDFQVVTDPKNVTRTALTGGDQLVGSVMGPVIARWLLYGVLALMVIEVILAWKLGHWSKSSVGTMTPPAEGLGLPAGIGIAAGVLAVLVGGVLLHNAVTGDFLGFLPDGIRSIGESALGVPEPVAGESTRWRLEGTPFLPGGTWLVGFLGLAMGGLVLGVYLQEGRTAALGYRLLLAGLRWFLLLLMLFVMLPELQLWFERQGWPDVAIIIDTSRSMSANDNYRDTAAKEAAAKLAAFDKLDKPQRLQLVQALLTHPDSDWLGRMLEDRKVKVHIFQCAGNVSRLADMTEASQRDAAAKAVRSLTAEGESSRLGDAVRYVLNTFRGSSLAAVVMITDGVTTEGEDLTQAGQYAAQMGVPLYLVGVGDHHEARDLILHDLQAEETVFVGDRVVFEARLTAQGYTNLPPVEVKLSEKTKEGRLKELARERVVIDPQGKPVKFRLTHQPSEAGEKTYVIEVPTQADEPTPADNNRLERTVFVREAKPSHVLYIEGYPRYEFRFIKSLLEREAANAQGNKTIDLKVMLLDADDEYPTQDRAARVDFPTKEELNQFDVVILGDVDPKHKKLEKHLKLLVDFVRERGGGLLSIAGERHNPQAFKETPLADILPIQVVGPGADPDGNRRDSFRPQLTPVGKLHPIFRFSPDEVENAAIWGRLSEIFWFAEGYRLQPAAEVLAVHPRRRAVAPRLGVGGDELHPLVAQHFVGAGRCMFFAFDETWRWRFREDEVHFNQFWIQTVKYLARSGLGKIDLRLNRAAPYRRGEPIQVTVRFPDDSPAPAAEAGVKVVAERRPLPNAAGAPAETEVETLQLVKLEGSRATFETLKTRTPEGQYRFWLSSPTTTGPRAECLVLPPPGEMEKLRMNQADLERAAEQTHGKFYTLADADKLLDDLPAGARVSLNTPGPPWLLWNHFLMFSLVLGLFAGEWVLRKRKHLL